MHIPKLLVGICSFCKGRTVFCLFLKGHLVSISPGKVVTCEMLGVFDVDIVCHVNTVVKAGIWEDGVFRTTVFSERSIQDCSVGWEEHVGSQC